MAWEIYRLSTGPWLDHRISDQLFTRDELRRACLEVFPGYELCACGGPRAIVVIWDAAAAADLRAWRA